MFKAYSILDCRRSPGLKHHRLPIYWNSGDQLRKITELTVFLVLKYICLSFGVILKCKHAHFFDKTAQSFSYQLSQIAEADLNVCIIGVYRPILKAEGRQKQILTFRPIDN